MLVSLLYVLPAILGLSFLIFFHELGHYFMARHVGMRVEVFSIGFGRPLLSWERDGVKWQIGWLLFGGFVKIAGVDPEDKKDPYTISDGFFGKSPMDRIKVAVAGPLVNLLLAFVFFFVIWASGGREKNFSEFTHKLGWIDPQSELYADGVRPGDEIVSYNQSPYHGVKDHIYVPMTSSGPIEIIGNKIDYLNGVHKTFEFTLHAYPHPLALDKDRLTTGVISPANYILYEKLALDQENALPEGSPMLGSGIEYGDRIVWIDGNLIFSLQQMSHLINDNHAFLTIVRGGQLYQLRVPRVLVEEFRLDRDVKAEISDWQYAAGLNSTKFQKLYMVPYNLNNNCVVQGPLRFIDKEHEGNVFPQHLYGANEAPLSAGDQIIAVDGVPVHTSSQLLGQLQTHLVNIVVERRGELSHPISWLDVDADFDANTNLSGISAITKTIGTEHLVKNNGKYVLLNPLIPRSRFDFELSPEKKAIFAAELQEQKKEIEKIEDSETRAHALAFLKNQETQLVLGLPVQDLRVHYNPSPFAQFRDVFSEIFDTLTALLSGSLNPKWVSGPIGIVQVVHDNWMIGIKEALFWLGAISLNLGMLNLLPIPVLDGGTIVISFIEMITGRRIPPKTLEKLIFPFAILLMGFFLFLTYQEFRASLSLL